MGQMRKQIQWFRNRNIRHAVRLQITAFLLSLRPVTRPCPRGLSPISFLPMLAATFLTEDLRIHFLDWVQTDYAGGVSFIPSVERIGVGA